MFQFFVEPYQIEKETITITGSDVNHMKNVLRMKLGEQVRVSEKEGQDYLCEILCMESEQIGLSIIQNVKNTELPVKITLFQGLPKSDKMELIIQKAVELGVYEIVPVAMKNCVVKLDEKKEKSKLLRWQTIATSAAKQSKRSLIPQVHGIRSFLDAVKEAESLDISLLPYEHQRGMANTREVFGKIEKGSSIGIFIGPEGGFASQEIEAVQECMELISLGSRILRTETAGIAALAMLIYTMED